MTNQYYNIILALYSVGLLFLGFVGGVCITVILIARAREIKTNQVFKEIDDYLEKWKDEQ